MIEPTRAPASGSSMLPRILVVAFFAAHLTCLLHQIGGDGTLRHRALLALFDEGRLTMDKYSIVAPLVSAPLLFLDRMFGTGDWFLSRFNVFVLAACVACMWRITSRSASPSLAGRFCVLLMSASFLPFSAGMYYGEMFTMVTAAVGLHGLATGGGIGSWALLCVGVANVPPMLLPLGFLALLRAIAARRPWPLLAPACALLLIAFENWLRRGSPASFGYDDDGILQNHLMPYVGLGGFSYPLLLGLLGLAFASGIGLFPYAPGLFFLRSPSAQPEGMRPTMRLWLLFVLLTALVFAKWWSWFGGAYWGPRFLMLGALPATLLLAQQSMRRHESFWSAAATLLCLCWSTWVCINGTTVAFHHLLADPALHAAEGSVMIWVPDISPLWYAIEKPAFVYPTTLVYASLSLVALAWIAWPIAKQCVALAPAAARELMRSLQQIARPS